jgi:undecaprenyl-diphosphatase
LRVESVLQEPGHRCLSILGATRQIGLEAARAGKVRGLWIGDQMNGDQGLFVPLILGIVEGLTEFLPVSSTAHILLIGHFLGFVSPGRTFEVLIQLGAIIAIVAVYFQRLVQILMDAIARKPGALRFILGVLLASLPAALAGVLLHDFIKNVIYETPIVICVMLIVGGIILLYVDQLKLTPKYADIYEYPPLLCLYIGLFQMLALVPGVSRSGATIVGSLLLGTDKRSAAEFTFFIAMPIMAGAFVYDLYKNRELITSELGIAVAIGFAAAFITAFFVVRYLLDYVSRHGFAIFAYWRIFVGAIGLWGVLLFK